MIRANVSRPSVAIVGAGWAGLACALRLARAGMQPVVYESAPEPGGRARRARLHGHWRDNGQHLMLAGCTALRSLCAEIGIALPRVPFAYTDGKHAFSLIEQQGRRGLIQALLGARGFSWGDRGRMVAALALMQLQGWSAPAEQTVADWLRQEKQPATLIEYFWEPLTLAILNTPIEQAAMRRLSAVLRDTLGVGCEALEILQPTTNLSESVVTPLVQAIEGAGGRIGCGQRVKAITRDSDGRYRITRQRAENKAEANGQMQTDATHGGFDHVVLAMPPWALPHIDLPAGLPFDAAELSARFGAQPIATVYLGFDTNVRLPTPLVQLAGPATGDTRIWAMDRAHCAEPGVITLSLSANGPWTGLDHATLVEHCLQNLQAAIGLSAPCRWHQVVSVKHATPAATTAANLLPQERSLWHGDGSGGIHLTGDWTHPQYSATLEAAVAAGFATAEKIIAKA